MLFFSFSCGLFAKEGETTADKVEKTQSAEPVVAKAGSKDELDAVLTPDIASPEVRERMKQELRRHASILKAQEAVVKNVAKLVAPSVVHIESTSVYAQGAGTYEEAGSGVIVFRNNQYYVLTNRHVIRDAHPADIKIRLFDNRTISPRMAWSDAETDIAVLLVEAPNLIPVEIGDSNRVEIGDFVLAIGSPFGLSQSVTFGIISAKGRRALDIGDANVHLQDFLQTDAAINPGNSGGPLLNLDGEVIAINTAIASNSGGSEGIGFSIPVRMVMLVADQLIAYGKVRRAYMGITLDGHFSMEKAQSLGLIRPTGACVTFVQEASPAARANFSQNDVILTFNGVTVEDDKHLYNLVNLAEIDKEIPVTVYRRGSLYKIQIRLVEKQ
ncbi:MAG: trypsin-like peptidase domain-containing protein [Planctomycetia bacterium]|nr:trypsin-like peptidase domain-containing protein [Planctomycetia bacterium]